MNYSYRPPGQGTHYGQPSRISVAKVLLVSGLAAGVYFGVTFLPHFWRSFGVAEILEDESSKLYSKRRLKEGWEQVEWDAKKSITDRLKDRLKVEGDDVRVLVQKKGNELLIRAQWLAHARYPFTGKTKDLRFVREVRTNLK
jgi:hypothetical protein